MAKNIMIQGTMSNAGKSLVCAGLCRILKQDGYRVAPFKSQNMALNSFITKDGGEMGRAQVVQAEAAGIEPDVRMNPILLKPTTDVGSQVIVNGQVTTQLVPYGGNAELPTVSIPGYTFLGWEGNATYITADTTITAILVPDPTYSSDTETTTTVTTTAFSDVTL